MANTLTLNFRRRPRHSLGRRVMSVMGLAMLSVLIGFTASATYFVNRVEESAWRGRQDEAARNAAGTMAAIIRRAQDTLAIIGALDLERSDSRPTQLAELDQLLEQNSTLQEVVRLDVEGRVLMESHRDRSVLAELITIPQSRWFLEARNGQHYLGPVELSHTDQPYVLMAISAPDGGVVAARVQMGIVWEAVANIRFGEAGRVYIVTRGGDIVAHTNSEVVLAQTNIVGRPELQAALAAPNAAWHGEYANFQGARVVGATAPVPDTNWIAITELPQAEAFAASRSALVILGGAFLLLMMVTMWGVTRAIDRVVTLPLSQLRDGARRVGQGDFSHRFSSARRDEIGELAQALDDMADDLGQRDGQVMAQTVALQISEARYRAIVEDQTELICRFATDGTLTFVNEAYGRYFGQTREALLGQRFAPLIPLEDQPLVEAHVASLGPAKPVAVVEHRVILPDGSIRWQHWTDRAILDAQGQVVEFQAAGQDITERRLAELAVRTSEENLRRITDNMFDVISQIDVTGVIQYASPSHKWVLGVEPNEIIGHLVFEGLHPDDLTPAMIAFSAALNQNDARQTVTFRYRHADGHYVWMEAIGNFIRDSRGDILGIILSSRDITARRQAELALSESERLYRLLAENATDLIWVRDMNLRLTYMSPAVYKLRGVTAEEAMTQGITEILTPESAETAAKFFADILNEMQTASPDRIRTESRRLESELIRKDGSTVWTESVMTFLFDTQGRPNGIQGVTRDISERRRAADELRRQNNFLTALHQVTLDLLHRRDENQLLDAIIQHAAGLLDATVGCIMLLEGADFVARAIAGQNLFPVGKHFTPDGGVVGWVYRNLRPLRLENYQAWPERRSEFPVTSILAVPILLGDHCLGELTLMRDYAGHSFQPEDEHFLILLAQLTALAVDNVQLYTAAQHELDERRQAELKLQASEESLRQLNSELEQRVQTRTVELTRANVNLIAEVTERQKADAALRESEARLRRITDNMLDMIVQTDEQGRYLYVSPSHKTILGYEPQDLLGRSIFENIHPADAELAYTTAVSAFGVSSPTRMELRYRHAHGHYIWIESVGNPLLDEQGRTIGSIIGSRDITARKEAETKLVQLRHAVDNSSEAIFMTDQQGVFTFLNPAFTRLYGYSAAEVIDQATPRILKSGLQEPDIYQDFWQTLLNKQVAAREMINRSRDGRLLTIETAVSPILDERGAISGFLAIQRDITERRQAEEQIKASLHEKEVLLKEIHHRVKNNLQIISSLLNLQANTTDDQQTLELLRDSQNRVRSMALVHEKLYRSPDLARISFADYAQSLTAQLIRTYSTVASQVALRVEVEDIWLDVDVAIPCGLIINELVSNALKHAFPGGRAGEIAVTVCNLAEGRIRLQVSDTGVGFPPGFDFRASHSLGLQLVNMLVDQLDGTVHLERGEGTRFQVEFIHAARIGG